ncbi:hypothetical protein ACBY01_15155 [Sphingomonas sp. ac-8]|uniref:hypothetical protein n=1 Tax=Sphingomonas sp. ac-8 TaxID=3242977 RepID=UPI003A8005C9
MVLFALAGIILAANVSPPASVGGATPDGNWASDCQPIGKGGRHGLVTRITIRGNRVEAHAQMYATSQCQTPTFYLTYAGRFTTRPDRDGSIELDHTVRSITLTAQAADVVSQYNLEGDHGCGLKGWQLNTGKSVAGKRCDPFSFPTEGTPLHDKVWIDADGLRFGAFPMVWTNISAGKRPTQPLPTIYRRVAD